MARPHFPSSSRRRPTMAAAATAVAVAVILLALCPDAADAQRAWRTGASPRFFDNCRGKFDANGLMEVSVSGQVLTNFSIPTFNGDGSYQRFTSTQVKGHLMMQPSLTFVDSFKTSFSCVDARGDEHQQGTPGGDLAEVVAGTMAWLKWTGRNATNANIDLFFQEFMAKVVTRSRPLYFHTDDGSIRSLLADVSSTLGGEPLSVLPNREPGANAAVWYEALTAGAFQGCGHIRLMILQPELYSLSRTPATDNVANACNPATDVGCISSAVVARRTIFNFFKYWWPTPMGSSERQRVKFAVDLGPLIGKAIIDVKLQGSSDRGGCSGRTALVQSNFGGSTAFIYHGDAVTDFRGKAALELSGLPKCGTVAERRRLGVIWRAIGEKQLFATVGSLPPANNIPLFQATVASTA